MLTNIGIQLVDINFDLIWRATYVFLELIADV